MDLRTQIDEKYKSAFKLKNIDEINTLRLIRNAIKNKDIETALKSGLINAESVITHHGAKNKLLKLSELNKLLKRKRIKVKVY